MKITLKTTVTFFLVFLTFNQCKKYELDDRRYYKTACGRIAKKWQLYKITDGNGYDYSKDTIKHLIYDKSAIIGEHKFVYYGMILEFEHVKSWLCADVGLRGTVNCENREFYQGFYELKHKRTRIKFDLIPIKEQPGRYFIHDYDIFKLTKDELILGKGRFPLVYFKAL